MNSSSLEKLIRRHKRVRAKVRGTQERPRLAVFRSLKHIQVQLIDDASGKTLAVASDLGIKKGVKQKRAFAVGSAIAKQGLALGIKKAVFDRGGYRYHGRVKALAEAARAGGLEF